jgi:hypothetical protein
MEPTYPNKSTIHNIKWILCKFEKCFRIVGKIIRNILTFKCWILRTEKALLESMDADCITGIQGGETEFY